jgi:hypothetical protein
MQRNVLPLPLLTMDPITYCVLWVISAWLEALLLVVRTVVWAHAYVVARMSTAAHEPATLEEITTLLRSVASGRRRVRLTYQGAPADGGRVAPVYVSLRRMASIMPETKRVEVPNHNGGGDDERKEADGERVVCQAGATAEDVEAWLRLNASSQLIALPTRTNVPLAACLAPDEDAFAANVTAVWYVRADGTLAEARNEDDLALFRCHGGCAGFVYLIELRTMPLPPLSSSSASPSDAGQIGFASTSLADCLHTLGAGVAVVGDHVFVTDLANELPTALSVHTSTSVVRCDVRGWAWWPRAARDWAYVVFRAGTHALVQWGLPLLPVRHAVRAFAIRGWMHASVALLQRVGTAEVHVDTPQQQSSMLDFSVPRRTIAHAVNMVSDHARGCAMSVVLTEMRPMPARDVRSNLLSRNLLDDHVNVRIAVCPDERHFLETVADVLVAQCEAKFALFSQPAHRMRNVKGAIRELAGRASFMFGSEELDSLVAAYGDVQVAPVRPK